MSANQPQRLQGKVSDFSGEGWGVVYGENKHSYFVRGAWPGEEVIFEVLKTEKRYSEAIVREVLKAHPLRRAVVPCVYHGFTQDHCGGCPWMFMEYSAQLDAKQKRLRYLVEKNKILSSPEALKEIVASPKEFAFRNRAQFKCQVDRLGFVGLETKNLVDVKECKVLNEKMSEHLKNLRAQLPKPTWKPVPPYKWNFIDVDDEQDSSYPINERRPFRQGNTLQNEFIKNWLAGKLKKFGKIKKALELYSGSGNFTRVLAETKIPEILAVEFSNASLKSLQNAELPGVQTFKADLSSELLFKKLAGSIELGFDLLVLDPPREGAPGLDLLCQELKGLSKIIYISCDARTWARDVAKLKGFHVAEIQPLDQFPHTPHLEILSVLEKSET